MNKKPLLYTLIALSSFAALSCQGLDVVDDEPEVLYVAVEGETRVQMGSGFHTFWNEGDLLSVFRGTADNDCWAFTGSTGDTSGELVKLTDGASSFEVEQTIVFYPYLEDNSILSENVISTVIDDFQLYEPDSYGVGANRMAACGTGDSFVLRNLCSFIEMRFTGTGVIESITLSGNDGEALSGSAEANVETLALTVKGSGKSITLDCGTGVSLSPTEPEAFIFALAPQDFSKGISALVKYTDGTQETKTTDSAIPSDRNIVVTITGSQEVTTLNVTSFEDPEQGDIFYW